MVLIGIGIGILFDQHCLLTHMKVTRKASLLTLSEKTLHLLTCLIVVDEDIEAQALEAFEQLAGISVRAVAYIHPCRDKSA